MIGAIYGDIIGSYYEWHSTKDYNFKFNSNSRFTDDSVLSAAVCSAILSDPDDIGMFDLQSRAFEYATQYKAFYKKYPHAGFGSMFISWAKETDMSVQHSYGNGAAMRAVPIGYAYRSLKQVLLQAKASCYYTHNHPEAISGAKAVAGSVWLALNGNDKKTIQEFCEKEFRLKMDTPIDKLRDITVFDSRTKNSVPSAIICFLQSDDYESAVRNAVSLGGDADTMACIAGGIAESYYKSIPEHIRSFCYGKMDSTIKSVVRSFSEKYNIQTMIDK